MTDPLSAAHDALEHLEEAFSGQIGLAAISSKTNGPSPLLRNEKVTFPPASVIKVPILFTACRLIEKGQFRFDDRIELTADDIVLGAGVLRDMEPGLRLTVRDLLTLMIIVSDNTATNMMIDCVGGPDVVNNDMAEFGLQDTYVSGKLMLPKEKRNAAQRAGRMSTTTPSDIVSLLKHMRESEALSTTTRQVAEQIMLRQHDLDSLTRYLPWPESQPAPPWTIGAKSGSINGVRNQVGWIADKDHGFTFAIFTKGCIDMRYFGENEGKKTVAKAFKIAFDYFFG